MSIDGWYVLTCLSVVPLRFYDVLPSRRLNLGQETTTTMPSSGLPTQARYDKVGSAVKTCKSRKRIPTTATGRLAMPVIGSAGWLDAKDAYI
jgi:hypothetical protein